MTLSGERAFELLKKIGFTRVAGSAEELQAAEILKAECEAEGVPAVIESFQIEDAEIETATFEILEPFHQSYEVTGFKCAENTPEGGLTAEFVYVEDGEEAFVWDMSALSEDVVAWLTVNDTNIDYPVMQGIDNSEYLNRDPFVAYSLAGSIFLDARNDPQFTDPYSLIYGHHMEYGRMFGALDDFLDEDYFDGHRTATLTVADRVYDVEFFACLEADASVQEIFAPTEAGGTLEYVRENAVVWREPEGEKLLALSTCKFPQTTERIIVFGVFE